MPTSAVPQGCGLQSLIAYCDSVADPIAIGDLSRASSLPTPYSPQWPDTETTGREPRLGGPSPDMAALQRYLLRQSQQRPDPPTGPSTPPTSSPPR